MNRQILHRTGFALALIWTLTLCADPAAAQQPPGEVKAWGLNTSGQLGDELMDSSSTPQHSWNASSVTGIAAGGYHSLAVKSDGTVLAWGDNSNGNLGNGTSISSPNVAPVPDLSGVVAVAAALHSLALKGNGTVWAWGDNSSGQLGDGTHITRSIPQQVPNLSGIVAIAAGDMHSLAVESYSCPVASRAIAESADKQNIILPGPIGFQTCTRVWAWGGGAWGQLGNGANADSNTPVLVSGLSDVVAVAAGHLHSLALKSDGTVWAWGYNEFGQLGNGTITDRNTPVQVTGLTGVTAISAGGLHSVALRSDGTVSAWGANGVGQLGNGSNTDSHVPVTAWLLPPVVAVAAGPFFTVATKADGTGWAWGWNHYGQLGNGTSESSSTPVQVSELIGAGKVSAGGGHALAIVNPRVSVSPTTLGFGQVPMGSSVCHTVHFTDGQDDAVLLETISISGANPGDFSFNWPFLPISISINVSLPIPVCFTPTASGARSATLVFGDFGFNGPHSISLSGSGFTPADLALSQSVVVSGRRLTYTINIRNNGPGPAPATTLSHPLPAQTQFVGISGPGCSISILGTTTCKPFNLASGGQATFTLALDVTATMPAQITSLLSVSSSVPDPDTSNNVSKLVTNWPTASK